MTRLFPKDENARRILLKWLGVQGWHYKMLEKLIDVVDDGFIRLSPKNLPDVVFVKNRWGSWSTTNTYINGKRTDSNDWDMQEEKTYSKEHEFTKYLTGLTKESEANDGKVNP